MTKVLVTGAGGFIGGHLVKKLLEDGLTVRAVDIKPLREWWQVASHTENIDDDLRNTDAAIKVCHRMEYIYQLAADMGGAGYVFSGENDSEILQNNARIDLNIARGAQKARVRKVLYASSACIYPKTNQTDSANPNCSEASAYPAFPDSEYGWEKLFSERLYMAMARNYGIKVGIARLHNVYGPYGSWNDGREKAPAALCRKVAELLLGQSKSVEIWGDGTYTRSFMYVDDCVDGLRRLMDSNVGYPLNLGSEEMVTINCLVEVIAEIAGMAFLCKDYDLSKPQGVAGRNSDNALIREALKWEPKIPLRTGLEETFNWILKEVQKSCTLQS